MKIGNPADKAPPVAPGRTAPGDGGKPASSVAPTAPATTDPSTTVALSHAAAELMAGESVNGDFDTEKVSRIAQAISQGKYEINAEVIADKLLSNAKEVLGNHQH
jgi:negative regulator of flagellin synthesis FlgM